MSQYELLEDMSVVSSWYKNVLSHGTFKKGTIFELAEKPTIEKKYYKLVSHSKFGDRILKVRKSVFIKNFKVIEPEVET